MAKRGLLANIFHRSDPNDRDQLRIQEEKVKAKVFHILISYGPYITRHVGIMKNLIEAQVPNHFKDTMRVYFPSSTFGSYQM